MRYWWVNHKQTFRYEFSGNYVWSPKTKRGGALNPFYETMREVAPGDVVFSYAGGVIQGFGYALMEELKAEDGRITTLNLGDLKLPNIQDVPDFKTVLVQEPAGSVPFNGKSIGEHSISPVAAAIANAVYDAVGVRITELPITAEKVYIGLQRKS